MRNLVCVLLLLVPCSASPALVVEQSYGQSVRGTVDGFPFVLLRGDHTERGTAHGALAGPEIIASLDGTITFLVGTGLLTWDDVLTAVDLYTFPARFETELAGMYDGIMTALPNEADRTIAALDRPITLEDLKGLQLLEVFELASCSQFSAWGSLTVDGEVIIGRNWDYPPIMPASTRTIFAIDPTEPDMHASIDAMWFGIIGVGMAVLRDDGLYLSGNDGGISEGGLVVGTPTAAPLILREAVDAARLDQAPTDVAATFTDRLALALLFHVSMPAASGSLPVIIEYDPRPAGYGTQFRTHDPSDIQDALIVTNHLVLPGTTTSGDSWDRYMTIRDGMEAYRSTSTPIGFDEALALLDSVSRSGGGLATRYAAIVWPAQRRLRISYAPTPTTSATQGTFVDVVWDEIFSVQEPLPALSPWSRLALAMGLLGAGLGAWRWRAVQRIPPCPAE